MTDTYVSPEVPAPTEPGWYAYDGGRQTMVFHLTPDGSRADGLQWYAHFDNGTADRCEWGYIEQALSVWNLVPLVPLGTSSEYVDDACVVMHDAYEAAAVGAGWETNPASRRPWADVPESNKVTMRAAVGALLARLAAGPTP